MRRPMVVQIPGSNTRSSLACSGVSIAIHGVEFPPDLIVLGTEGIDVVLGMNWLSRYRGRIDCTERTVNLTSADGVQIEYTDKEDTARAFCHQSVYVPSLKKVKVVCEFPDVFPEELAGIPLDRDIELVPGTAPIAQRPYRKNA